MAIAAGAARLLLRGLRPGDYPRGGPVHVRLWLAEQIADQVDAVGLAGAPWIGYYARALGARIGSGVDLHALSGNLCRCGTYPHVFDAAMEAQKRRKGGK